MSDGIENSKNSTIIKEDDELSELMNSAMADLGKNETKKSQGCSDEDLDAFMEQLDRQAIQDASKNFETMLDAIMKKVESEKDTNDGNFSEEDKNFFNDMKKFMETANTINNGCSEEEMNRIMSEFENPNSFMKNFTEMLMEEMTNKETMYPPIKEMRDKFPQFLEEKNSTLSEEELKKYKKQQEIVEKICVEFERENYDENDEDQKGERIIFLTKMFNELHSYGFVPQELSPNIENLGDPSNCAIM
uniref:Peroxin-19 n=1 Tax=Strongyloides papillosus TaxID=174720 RepID=A0A0N5BY26_STREA